MRSFFVYPDMAITPATNGKLRAQLVPGRTPEFRGQAGMVRNLYDWSDDMEFMEIIMPGKFATTEITSPAELPC